MDPRPLEHVDTDDLIDELRSRSRVFFLAMRSLAVHGADTLVSTGVDGRLLTKGDEERDRCIGMAHRGVSMLYRAEVSGDE